MRFKMQAIITGPTGSSEDLLTRATQINQFFRELKKKERNNPTIFETILKLNLWHYTLQELESSIFTVSLVGAHVFHWLNAEQQFGSCVDETQNQLNYFQNNQQHSNKYFRSTFHESSPGNPEIQHKDITISSKFFGTKAFYEGLYMKMKTLFTQKNKPMVFFTFTANPNMFGHKLSAYGWVTENQKRGNPHIHSVLALDEPVDENGNLFPEVIDDIIQAYYPTESSPSSEDIKSFMVHRCRNGGCLCLNMNHRILKWLFLPQC
ncbi:unnamed protein product [Ambrosiozyma monospora]|uniref:Unnamed protein product n=1 Tax=Ambrosiozyma monospora TaxID=43982 RepID=A0A9W7DHH9_AMBMO|nr:unnamed protein product [Ambrosiozyma monospora]